MSWEPDPLVKKAAGVLGYSLGVGIAAIVLFDFLVTVFVGALA